MKITITQTEEGETYLDALEDEDVYEMTWGELSAAQGDKGTDLWRSGQGRRPIPCSGG